MDEIRSRNRWRLVRIILGQLQIVGSTAALFLLASQGVTDTALWIFSVTMVVTLTSIVLFRILKVQKQEQGIVK